MSRELITALQERRAQHKTELDKLLAEPTKDKRNLNETEAARFSELETEIRAIDTRVSELDTQITRDAEASQVAQRYLSAQTRVTSEPLTYQRGNGNSYFRDLGKATLQNDTEAAQRLARHAQELDVELPAREHRREQRAAEQMTALDRDLGVRGSASVFESRTNPNRTDGQGGYFVPPLWLVDEFIDLPRYGRPLANAVRNLALPTGTDSVNVPKIATGTRTGVQTADAGAVVSQDLTDTFVNAPVRTIAGQQDVAMQLLDQSPISFDEVIFSDLIADYNMQLDTQCWTGTGSSGQVLGVLNVSGVNAVTYTDASPTLPLMYPSLMKALSQVATKRKAMPNSVWQTPSRWFWMAAQLDGQSRPLVLPEANSPFNPALLQTGGDVEGPVGRLSNFPIMADGNIPNNLGGGSNEERIVAMRTSDIFLWEGAMKTRVLPEVLSGTLQVRFQLYNYAAFMANRRPESISVISGTGVIAPSGY
ncbi:phage major capsid protein [Pseudonocardiaceae bacterium YIM PH 21723]|nr:phage major capsid protein [Pseudonocardiaceae bacterium YIM PH 21723]